MQRPVRRFAVRALLLDERDRLLLLRSEEPESGAAFWFPPGGGVDEGEALIDSLRREVFEEVGLAGLHPGPEVWRRRHVFEWRGVRYDQSERWFLCRVPHFEPDGSARKPDEVVDLTQGRWWTVEELAETTERLIPRDLAARLGQLLSEGAPSAPIAIGV